MRFDTSQQMKLGQQMKLAPRMIQSMEILQMPLTELEERIEQELENNVTLEQVENRPDETDPGQDAHENRDDSASDDFERLDAFENADPDAAANEYEAQGIERTPEYRQLDSRRVRNDGERDAKLDAMAATPARSASLPEQLLDQWSLADVDDHLRPLGELIIGFLEDDGYLRTPLETVSDRAPGNDKPGAEELARALTALQLFLDPPGVAARDVRECLLLQLDALEDDADHAHDEGDLRIIHVARELVEHHLDDLLQNRLPKIAESSDLSIDDIKRGIALMKRLSTHPARRLVADDVTPITPDAIVEYDEEHDRYFAYLNERSLPALRVNRYYASISKDRSLEKKDRDFIKTNIANAQWLIDAVQQRKQTLQRVLNVVVDAQREFFDFGPQSLRPLPMTQVAEELGIHVATVSRAVSEKYLLTPRGVFPLRRFFSGGTQTDEGEDVSWEAVRAALQEVIDAEDKARPLGDEALAGALKDKGIEIARRTVAKYRAQLGIPSARLRRQF